MKYRASARGAAISVCLAAMLIAACGSENPEAMLASAKDYIAKGDTNAAVIQIKNVLQKNPQLGEARFLLGKAFLESGNPAGAQVELRKALELKVATEQVMPLLARAMLETGQARKVVDEMGKIDLPSPEGKAELLTTLAGAHAALGDAKAADAALAAALNVKPDHARALLVQARVKASKRDLAGALADVEKVLVATPRSLDAWLLKGDVLRAQGQAEGAQAAYRKAIEIKPDFVVAHSSIITSLMAEGKIDVAGQQLEALKKVAAKNPQTLFIETQFSYQKKDFPRTRELAQQLLKIAPENGSALQIAGAVEYQLKSYVQAESYLTKALKVSPNLGLARRFLTVTYLRMGQPQKALSTLQPVLDKIDNDPGMLALAGEVHVQNGEIEKAEKFFLKATTAAPNAASMRTALALTRLIKGNVDSAYDELHQISASDTGTTADMALISSHLRRKEFDKALKAIDTLEKKQPNDPATHNLRGNTLIAKRDVAAARKSFEQALKVKPGFFPAAASLASLDLADKKPELAQKRFEDVLAVDPKSVQALMALAELRSRTGGKVDEVAALIGKAISADPTSVGPRLALVELYLRNKDTKKAVSAAQDAVATMPDRPEILDVLGRTQQVAGETNQALSTFGKLASLQPDSPLPHRRMAEIHLLAKNRSAAEQSLRKALQIKPDQVEVQGSLIGLLVDAGSHAQAIEIARDIQKRRPKEPAGYALEGDIAVSRKQTSEAVAAYSAGLKAAPTPELAIKLHRTLFVADQRAEADKFAASWLKDHPKDLSFRFHLGDMALTRKNYEGAVQQYRLILEAQPENAVVLNNMAWVTGQMKGPKAIEYAEKANKIAPNQAPFMDTLATLLAEKGDTARALELLKKAVELAPQMGPIRLSLAKVQLKAGNKDAAKKELETLAKLGDKFAGQDEVKKLLQGL